jgi:hypothetical protein
LVAMPRWNNDSSSSHSFLGVNLHCPHLSRVFDLGVLDFVDLVRYSSISLQFVVE